MGGRIKKLSNDTDGQILILVLAILFVLVLFFITIPNVTHIISAKMRTQTAADCGAYSGAVWLARGLNLIACLNIGIKTMYHVMIVITAILVIFCALWVIGCFPPLIYLKEIAAIVLGFFFCGPQHYCLEPTTAINGWHEDIEHLYHAAEWMADKENTIAEVMPYLSLSEGSRIATVNISVLESGFGIVIPKPLDRIPLVDVDGFFSEMNDIAASISWENPSGGDDQGILQFDPNGGISGGFTQEYTRSVTIFQFFSKDTSMWQENPYPPPDSFWKDTTLAWPDTLDSTFRYNVDFDSAFKYRPIGGSLLEGHMVPESNGYMFDDAWYHEDKAETTFTVDTTLSNAAVPKKLSPDEPLYVVAFAVHQSTQPILANTEGTFAGAKYPLGMGLGIAQAEPYLTRNFGDSVFNPSWDARICSVTAIEDIISSDSLPSIFGDIIEDLRDHLLIH